MPPLPGNKHNKIHQKGWIKGPSKVFHNPANKDQLFPCEEKQKTVAKKPPPFFYPTRIVPVNDPSDMLTLFQSIGSIRKVFVEDQIAERNKPSKTVDGKFHCWIQQGCKRFIIPLTYLCVAAKHENRFYKNKWCNWYKLKETWLERLQMRDGI